MGAGFDSRWNALRRKKRVQQVLMATRAAVEDKGVLSLLNHSFPQIRKKLHKLQNLTDVQGALFDLLREAEHDDAASRTTKQRLQALANSILELQKWDQE